MPTPTLNGTAPSWAEIETTINVVGGETLQTVDYSAINWESKVTRGKQKGASGGRTRKRTKGEIENSADAEFYRDGLRTFKKKLAAVAPKDEAGRPMLSQVTFDVIIKHSVADDPEIYVVKLLGCHLDGNSGKHAEGPDADKVGVDLNPLEVVEVIDGQDTVLL